jgi:hypothetical protein
MGNTKMNEKSWVEQQIKKIDNDEFRINPLHSYFKFRIDLLQEELNKMKTAFAEENSTEVANALNDLMAAAIETTNAFNIDKEKLSDHTYLPYCWKKKVEK